MEHILITSSHELFDEYTRRQYLAKAPEKNPFGDDETPLKFADFDVFKKVSATAISTLRECKLTYRFQLRVLQQMTQFVMMNPDRLREKTEEQRDTDQATWVR